MSSDEACEHQFLWDGSEAGWVVWLLNSGDNEAPRYSIYNRLTRMAMVIEDDAVAAEVIQQMIDQGVDVITEYPG